MCGSKECEKWMHMFHAHTKRSSIRLKKKKKLAVEKFTVSNGWLESFKKRYNISEKILSSESNDVGIETMDNFKERIAIFTGLWDKRHL